MIILGIDPGNSRMGYGFIEEVRGRPPKLITAGTLQSNKKDDRGGKLLELGNQLERLIVKHDPKKAGVESIFFSKNQKTAIAVAEARGVAIYLLRKHRVSTLDLSPNEVKAAVTGDGQADKRAVAKMVKIILNLKELKGFDDATDAVAIALAAARA